MTTGCGIPMTSEAARRAYPDTVIESHGFTLPLSFAYERGIYDRGAVDALRAAWQAMSEQGVGLNAETMPKGEFGYQTTLDWLWGLADERERETE